MTTPITIAILAPGMMGAGLGARMVRHGARVLVPLEGRSAASRARAEAAGMRDASVEEVAAADMVLSVVSPAHAVEAARRVADAGGAGVFADLNAVSPERAAEVAAIVSQGGFHPLDGGIVGGPPRDGYTPTIHLSGDGAGGAAETLEALGLRVSLMEGGIGRASALKLGYAGITKGLTALGAAMLLSAGRAGVADALVAELRESQPELARRLGRALPDMLPKAERWAPEMEEIAALIGSDRAGHAIYRDAATLFARLAADLAEDGAETAALRRLAADLGAD